MALCPQCMQHAAAWLDKLGIVVAYLELWDAVDFKIGWMCWRHLRETSGRHDTPYPSDETRRFFLYVLLRSERKVIVEELVFPGGHSDVGGLYEDDHQIADVALAWIAAVAEDQEGRLDGMV